MRQNITVSIITIAYNCEDCIAQTLESVADQSYDKIEYLIIDGNSSDNTVKVAESYRERMQQKGIAYAIISEADEGIYDAMNKGIALATGDIIGLLNSGDWYEEDAVQTAVDTIQNKSCDLMFANIRMWKENGSSFIKKARQRNFQTSRDWNHPTTFVKAKLYKEHPFRQKGIHDDYGFYLEMKKLQVFIVTVDKVLANFRMGGASNHKNLKAAVKRIQDRYQYCYRINGYSRWYIVECIAIEVGKMLLG